MKQLGLIAFVVATIAGLAHAAGEPTNPLTGTVGADSSDRHQLHSALPTVLAREEVPVSPQALRWASQKVVASDGRPTGTFGYSVAISGDTAIIGVQVARAAYVFVRSDEGWVETQKLEPTDAEPDESFGTAVAIHGSRAVISSYKPITGTIPLRNAVYVFDKVGGKWSQTARLAAHVEASTERFGQAVAVFDRTVLVGAFEATIDPYKPRQGAAYVFTETGGNWSLTQTLTASDAKANEEFGFSVALHGDTALVSARKATLDRDEPHEGAAYVFEANGGSWNQTQKLVAGDGRSGFYFGTSVAVHGDTAVVGAPNVFGNGQFQGAAYVFGKSANRWTPVQKLVSRNGQGSDQFGRSIALSGSTLLIGAYGRQVGGYYQQGAAYAFTESNGRWTQAQEFLADTAPISSWVHYGWAVALDGANALVGSHLAPVDGTSMKGAAYFYTASAAPTARIAQPSLQFVLVEGETGSVDLGLTNLGDHALDYEVDPSSGPSSAFPLVERGGAPVLTGKDTPRVAASGRRGAREHAPWLPLGGADLLFELDDGSYEDTITLNHEFDEADAIWLNRFSAPLGTGAFTLDSISIQWPQNDEGSLLGKEVNLLVYYDPERNGDPARALRLGGDHFVTVDELDSFIQYPVDFRVPGDGDIYVGFENSYARGDSWPKLYPAALDTDSPQGQSWLIGNGNSDADPDRLGGHDYLATVDSFGLAGNWLIRATGTDADNDCIAASAVPWLAVSPAQGSVAPQVTQALQVTANASGLALGRYAAQLCLATNDPDQPLLRVPVNLRVLPADGLFADGFEVQP